jgi:hypothetical protein
MRLDDLEHEAGGDRGVERVAACFEESHARCGREPVRGRDHSERAVELGAGGEHRAELYGARCGSIVT